MTLTQIASAILNDLWGGNLIPVSNRSLISLEQIEDEVIEERSSIIREWYAKNTLQKNDVAIAINCIDVDCKDPSMCGACKNVSADKIQHFEIPPIIDGLGEDAIIFIGSVDREESYKVYFSKTALEYQKYKRFNSDKPYVYIEKVLNENNMYDGWIFNAPFVKTISVIAIFKDPRKLEGYNCCNSTEYLEMGSISSELIRRILAKKTQLYRALPPAASQIVS